VPHLADSLYRLLINNHWYVKSGAKGIYHPSISMGKIGFLPKPAGLASLKWGANRQFALFVNCLIGEYQRDFGESQG